MPTGTTIWTFYTGFDTKTKETSASCEVINESEQTKVDVLYRVWWWRTHTQHTERGAALCNALASLWRPVPALFCSAAAKQDHNMGLSLPQQQALYYYSHAWLTPGLPAVHRHRKSQFGAVFFCCFFYNWPQTSCTVTVNKRVHFTGHWGETWHYNDNINQTIALNDGLLAHIASTSRSLLEALVWVILYSFFFFLILPSFFLFRSRLHENYSKKDICSLLVTLQISLKLQF